MKSIATSLAASGAARPAATPSRDGRPRSSAGSSGPIRTSWVCRCSKRARCCRASGTDTRPHPEPRPTMRIDDVLVTALPGDYRAAALAGGVLVRLALAGDDDEIRAGDVILGRVTRVVASIGGAFVDLGHGPSGVLMQSDAPVGG